MKCINTTTTISRLAGVASAIAFATSAWGQSFVAIQNPGFEDPVIPVVGDFVTGVPDWSAFDGGAGGVINPSADDFPALAPEGTNVAYVFNSVAGKENGISQTLSALLQEDATYTLTVEVGDPLFFNNFPGYRIQLLAGGSVLAEDDNTLTITPGEFATSTAVYAYEAADAALLGQPLEIRLLTKGLAIGTEVNFDDVQLAVTLANPAADPGGPYLVSIPDGSLSLNGANSLPSADATITTWEWDLTNDGSFDDATGTTPAAIDQATLTADPPTGFGMVEGDNTIKLRVTDDSSPTPKTSIAETTVTLAKMATVYTGPSGTGGTDRWNVNGNWDNEVPSGTLSAIIPDAESFFTVAVTSASTPAYTGDLTLGDNVSLQIGWVNGSQFAACYNALGTPGSTTIHMGENSRILNRNWRGGRDWTVPAVVLNGNAAFRLKDSTEQSTNPTFDYPVTGSHTLRIQQPGNATFNVANSFDGLIVEQGSTVATTAAGTLGIGNVTINDNSRLTIGAEDSVADSATLSLSGTVTNQLTLNVDETVALLTVDGFPRPAGTYGRGNTPATVDFEVSWMGGDSVLTVTNEPVGTTVNLPAITDPVSVFTTDTFVGNSMTYTLTFDEVVTTTATTEDFENTGTAPVTIDSVTQPAENVIEVVMTPTDTGTMNLGAKASATIEGLFGNTLSGPFTDDVTFDVLAGPTPTLIITGTAGGNDSWNTGDNWDSGFPPFGIYPALITDGVVARVQNTSTEPYSGGLTIGAGSELDVRNATGSENAIGTGTVTFNSGATLRLHSAYTVTIPADIVFAGDAQIFNSGNGTDNKTRIINGDISGTGLFTYSMRRGNVLQLNGTNTWSGGFVANFVDTNFGNASRVQPANSGFGTGDVTLNDGITLEILSGRGDTIDDGAALFLNGRGRSNQKLMLGSNETVGQLWVDNTVGDGSGSVQLPAGDYTATSSPGGGLAILDITGNPLITGSGTLTVLSGPATGSPYDTWATGGELFGDDANGDGVSNGLAFLLGASGPNVNARGLLPAVIEDGSGGLVMTFSMLDSASRGTATLSIEHSSDLGVNDPWTTVAVPDASGGPASGVTFVVSGSGTLDVTATVDPAEAGGTGKLFGRLKATE